jgi:hypothetical protein
MRRGVPSRWRQGNPLRCPGGGVTDLDHVRLRRHDRIGGVIHEYHLVA